MPSTDQSGRRLRVHHRSGNRHANAIPGHHQHKHPRPKTAPSPSGARLLVRRHHRRQQMPILRTPRRRPPRPCLALRQTTTQHPSAPIHHRHENTALPYLRDGEANPARRLPDNQTHHQLQSRHCPTTIAYPNPSLNRCQHSDTPTPADAVTAPPSDPPGRVPH